MKVWKILSPKVLTSEERPDNLTDDAQAKVKVTQLLLSGSDVRSYSGALRPKYPVVPGMFAVGVVGSGAESETGAAGDHTPVFTDPASVVEFTGRTGVDALAVSIGTAHGVYESAPNLDIARLAEIDKVSPVPLVLHGGSGTPEDQLRAAIANGIAKINIYSELTAAWNREMFEFLRNRREMTCWFSVSCRRPEEAMREAMRAKMRLFGSAGRA